MFVCIVRNIYISPIILKILVYNSSISAYYYNAYNHIFIEKFSKKT